MSMHAVECWISKIRKIFSKDTEEDYSGVATKVKQTFEGRIRRVWKTHLWMCDVYGTERQEHNGCYYLANDVVEDARRLSRTPQKLAAITYSWNKGKIIRIEPLEE